MNTGHRQRPTGSDRTRPNARTGWRLGVALLAVGLVAAACGGRDEPADGGGGDGSSTTVAEAVNVADPADCTSYAGTTGADGATIKIGNSLPQSGTFKVFDKVRVGINAYFQFANAGGGVQGKQMELVSLDDAYLPERTRANAETLTQSDGVFALLGLVGTENNKSVQQYFAETGQCVPNLAVATGFPGFGDPGADPWIINGLPNYGLESVAFADYLEKNKPQAKVAILSQNDSFGESYVTAFKQAIEGTGVTVVAEQTFDPRAESNAQGQVTTLAGSGADALLLGVTSIPCPTALKSIQDSGWKPLTYVTLTCSSKVLMDLAGTAAEGTISTRATYDPSDPDNQSQPSVQEFRTEGAKYGLTPEDLDDLNVATGWNFGAYLVQLLKASPELERSKVMNTAWSQSGVTFGMNLDGIEWTTNGTEDPFGYEQLQFVNRTGGKWVPEGEIIDYGSQIAEQGGN
jgi:branched-chain amino acid transport system substrate-binding protein